MKNKNNKRFKSCILNVSRKKILPVIRYIKNFSMEELKNYMLCLNKKYSRDLYKFAISVINNLVKNYNLTKEEALSSRIRFIVIEKTNRKITGLRYAAKGRAFRSTTVASRLNMYLN